MCDHIPCGTGRLQASQDFMMSSAAWLKVWRSLSREGVRGKSLTRRRQGFSALRPSPIASPTWPSRSKRAAAATTLPEMVWMSQRWSDLTITCEMVNSYIRPWQWTHYCWDSSASKACCMSKEKPGEDHSGVRQRYASRSADRRTCSATCATRCCELSPTGSASAVVTARVWVQVRGRLMLAPMRWGDFAQKARAVRSWHTEEYYSAAAGLI